MASIRRTLSSSNFHDHAFPKSSSSSFSFLFLRKPSRKFAAHRCWWWWWWKRYLLRFFLFFILGFLLGLSPFFHLHHFGPIPTPHPHFHNLNLNPIPHRNLGALRHPHPPPPPPPRRLLIVVTPTYNRGLQAYYLSRLGQTLRLVEQPLLWIVVEMGSAASGETAEFLRGMGIMYRHLVCERNSSDVKDRGVHQRNTAMEHIQRHRLDGIVYFADDDNIYSLQLFQQLREIRRFGTWPVAMLAQSKNKATLEGPVCDGSQVIGWHTNEKSKRLRRFHVDMSGFAFNSTILWDPTRWRRPTSDAIRQLDTVKEGFQETTFIEQLVEDEYQMEGQPHNCSRIMNWHLHLEARHFVYPKGWQASRNLDVVSSLR